MRGVFLFYQFPCKKSGANPSKRVLILSGVEPVGHVALRDEKSMSRVDGKCVPQTEDEFSSIKDALLIGFAKGARTLAHGARTPRAGRGAFRAPPEAHGTSCNAFGMADGTAVDIDVAAPGFANGCRFLPRELR